jgi:hypothetical protein
VLIPRVSASSTDDEHQCVLTIHPQSLNDSMSPDLSK